MARWRLHSNHTSSFPTTTHPPHAFTLIIHVLIMHFFAATSQAITLHSIQLENPFMMIFCSRQLFIHASDHLPHPLPLPPNTHTLNSTHLLNHIIFNLQFCNFHLIKHHHQQLWMRDPPTTLPSSTIY